MPRLFKKRTRPGETKYELGRAAVYSRVSNPGDTREASLETQEKAVAARLLELGYDVSDETDLFRDRFTGKETIRRPELNRMRMAVRQGIYKAVGVYKLDRLSRNMGQCFILLGEMDDLAVRPVSVLEPNIDDSPQGKMYRMMGSYMAEAELASLEDRFGRGREHIAERNLPLARGTRSYGLVFNKKGGRTFSVDDDDDGHDGTIKWVRVIFGMAADGSSGHAIAIHLNSLGVLPPGLAMGMQYRSRGHTGLWSAAQVIKVIKNPVYRGWSIEGKFYSDGVTDKGHSVMKPVPEDEWVVFDKTGAITPRVVSDDQWVAANATIQGNALNRNSHARKSNDYLLRGLIYCHKCGEKMYGSVNRHGRVVYRCANHTLVVQKRRPESCRCDGHHVHGSWIEPLVWGELRGLIVTPGRIEEAVVRVLASSPATRTKEDLDMAKSNLEDQERIRDKFFKKWREEESKADADEEVAARWESEYRSFRVPIDSLKKAVEQLSARLSAEVSPDQAAAAAASRFDALRVRLSGEDDTTQDERREALLVARARVVVTGNGKRSGKAGGTGEVFFDLFGEGDHPTSSPARCCQMNSLISVALNVQTD